MPYRQGLDADIRFGMVICMKIHEYLSATGLSQDEFARKVGVSQATISRYASGLRTPRLPHALAILTVTGGRVTPEDFLESNHTKPAEVVHKK